MLMNQTLWSLAPDQMNTLERYRHTVHRLAIRSGETNRMAAEAAVGEIYRALGYVAPTQFIWAEDPIEGAVLATIYPLLMDYQTAGPAYRPASGHWLSFFLGQNEPSEYEQYKIPPHATSPAYLYFMEAAEKLSFLSNTGDESLWERLWAHTCALAVRGKEALSHPTRPLLNENDLIRPYQNVFGPVFVRQVVKTVAGDSYVAQEFARNQDLNSRLFQMIELPSYADLAAHKGWEAIRRQLIRTHQQATLTLRNISSLAAFAFLGMLNGTFSTPQAEALLKSVDSVGQFWHFGDTVIMCPKPTQLHLNPQNRLHAEGRPAVNYSGRYALYANSGEALPEQYGRLPISKWQPQWLLEESDIALRRLMIRQIGYGRICQELPSVSIDRWEDYELLQINDADIEPMMLIKMKCPSTGMIHVHRVPPTLHTAREAIAWCNWEIDAETFLQQT